MSHPSGARRPFSRRVANGCSALFALAILLAGCGGSDTSLPSEPTSTPASAARSSDRGESGETSPLLDLIGVPLATDEAIENYYNELYAQAELQITACMVVQGFEYTPIDYSQLDLNAGPVLESREFAEEHGYGIVSLDEASDLAAGMIQEIEDPNAAYVESLSAAEFAAFDEALYGPRNDGSEPSGCQDEAFEDAFAFIVVFEEFGFAFEDVEAAVAADPRLVDVQLHWATCMAEAGYAFANRAEAEGEITTRLEDLLRDSNAFAGGTLRSEVEHQIDRLAAEERAIAVAGWECDEPLRELERTVEVEYERRFVDEHGGAIRAALGKSAGG